MQTTMLKDLRRVAIIFIIVSLSLTALVGIVTLLTASFGEVQGKIILTTLLVAGFSITALCHLAVVGRALRIVGYVGIAMSAAALITGAILIWGGWLNWGEEWEALLKTFAVVAILAVSLAHANLLLILESRRNQLVRIGLYVTIAMIALLSILIILPIVTEGEIPGDQGEPYFRFLGVVAILDALGTIVLPVVARFSRAGEAVTSVTFRLQGDAAAKVARLAAATGSSHTAVVEAAVAAAPEPPASDAR